jgi:hypothetical protein
LTQPRLRPANLVDRIGLAWLNIEHQQHLVLARDRELAVDVLRIDAAAVLTVAAPSGWAVTTINSITGRMVQSRC